MRRPLIFWKLQNQLTALLLAVPPATAQAKLHVDFVKIRTTESAEAYFGILREARRAGLEVAGHQPSVASVTVAVDSGQQDIEHAIGPPLSRISAEARDQGATEHRLAEAAAEGRVKEVRRRMVPTDVEARLIDFSAYVLAYGKRPPDHRAAMPKNPFRFLSIRDNSV